jgi:malonate-semialdehyde dehydrogenase (acetylating)/methylmalonate-semialdehyde dehydrogenase
VTRRFSPRRSTRPRPSHRRQALHRLVRVGDDATAHRDNGTAIFTRDGDAARAFANNVKIGMVGINVPIPVPVAYHSFGGWKASIFGDPGIYGMEGVRFCTKLKTVTARWPTGIRSSAEFAFKARN